METYCSEVSRVLKKGKYFVMIIGSNTNQTGGIRLEDKIIELSRQIKKLIIKSLNKYFLNSLQHSLSYFDLKVL